MAERNNDKGLITWVATIVNLVVGIIFALGLIGGCISTLFDFDVADPAFWTTLVLAIVWACFAWYWIKRSILIILGKEANTWVYVVVSFFMGGLIGGIAMLIAKILN